MIEVNQAKLEQIIREAAEPVLVQFWATWSASCTAMTTILSRLIEDPSVPFTVARVNLDPLERSPRPYGVHTVPTVLIFSQGQLRHQIIGLTTEQDLREKLEQVWHDLRRGQSGSADDFKSTIGPSGDETPVRKCPGPTPPIDNSSKTPEGPQPAKHNPKRQSV